MHFAQLLTINWDQTQTKHEIALRHLLGTQQPNSRFDQFIGNMHSMPAV